MLPKEGETAGNLADYVTRRLAVVADQKAEEERRVAEEGDRAKEEWFNYTAPLRAHLLELVKPIEELLGQFRAEGLLEEVKSQFWKEGKLSHLYPRIYQTVVINEPNPYNTQTFEVFRPIDRFSSEVVQLRLDQLVHTQDFHRWIPVLEGYGLQLIRTFSGEVSEFRYSYGGSRHSSDGPPDYGGSTGSGGNYPTGRKISANIQHTMSIESTRDVLLYRLSQHAVKKSGVDYGDSSLPDGTVLSSLAISSKTTPEALLRTIGDDVIRYQLATFYKRID